MEHRHKSLLRPLKQEQTGKPPAAKPLRSRWIPDDDPTPRVNVNYRKVPRQFIERRKRKWFNLKKPKCQLILVVNGTTVQLEDTIWGWMHEGTVQYTWRHRSICGKLFNLADWNGLRTGQELDANYPWYTYMPLFHLAVPVFEKGNIQWWCSVLFIRGKKN